jgi:hypothetical protein
VAELVDAPDLKCAQDRTISHHRQLFGAFCAVYFMAQNRFIPPRSISLAARLVAGTGLEVLVENMPTNRVH